MKGIIDMYCTNCGKDIGQSAFCPYCGTPKANDEPSAEALKNDEINAEITNDVNIPEQENVSAESADNSQENSTIYEYAPAQEKPAASVCVSCGSEIPEGAPFCTQCGAPQNAPKKKKLSKGGLIAIIVAAVILTAAVIGVIIAFALPKQDFSKILGMTASELEQAYGTDCETGANDIGAMYYGYKNPGDIYGVKASELIVLFYDGAAEEVRVFSESYTDDEAMSSDLIKAFNGLVSERGLKDSFADVLGDTENNTKIDSTDLSYFCKHIENEIYIDYGDVYIWLKVNQDGTKDFSICYY